MKTKLIEKEKKKRKRKTKRKEAKMCLDSKSNPFGAPGESFTNRPRGTHRGQWRNVIIKTFEPY